MKHFSVAVVAAMTVVTVAAEGFDRERFQNPESMFSPGYFWMWNAKLDVAKLNAQLDDMVAHGVRSVCVHPFPVGFRPGKFATGMEPDYLTPEYLDVFARVVDHMAELGMSAWLYDEGGWPSGGAAGLVARSDSEGRFRHRYYGRTGMDDTQPNRVWVRPYDPSRASFPSVIEPGATERFLEITHEAYKKVIGRHFGKTIKFAFTDEPEPPRDARGPSLAWSTDFAEQFKARKGYDFRPLADGFLAEKFTDSPTVNRLRVDYNDVLGQLFTERYFDVVRDWCHKNGLKLSGHMSGEDIPEMSSHYGYGSLFADLRAMDVPGVDVIWRQLYPTTVAHPGSQLPFPRYASSVGHQKGERLALSESFGIYGDSFDPERMKWLADYQLVRGINLFVFGYYAVSNAGQWMTLFEPHSGPVTPWWDFIRPYFDYVSRTASLLAEGSPTAETAVFFDTRGFWARGADGELAGRLHYAVAAALDRRNVEYEFVDDEALAKAEVKAGALVVGKMSYRTLVLPTSKWMSEAARAKLKAFKAVGGRVLTADEIAKIRPTCHIASRSASGVRVAKRVKGEETLYFLVNELGDPIVDAKISFDEKGPVVRADAEAGRFVAVDTKDGAFTCAFPPYGSALFIVGGKANAPAPAPFADKPVRTLDHGWTLRPIVRHSLGKTNFEIVCLNESARPVGLGDWRDQLGETFSGRAVYTTTFNCETAAEQWLDLGAVRWVCSVKLNGQSVGTKFFGPYRWRVQLQKGKNVLEVTVANMLCNLQTEEARRRVTRDYPPLSPYENRQGVFDRENHESGLLGPVTLR